MSQSRLANKLGLQPKQMTASTSVVPGGETPLFSTPEEQKVAQITYEVIRTLENQPGTLPSVTYLQNPEVRETVLREVTAQYRPQQMELEGSHHRMAPGSVKWRTITEHRR